MGSGALAESWAVFVCAADGPDAPAEVEVDDGAAPSGWAPLAALLSGPPDGRVGEPSFLVENIGLVESQPFNF